MSGYVSDYLISEIFERLPVKSLLRFRSLSKSWYCRFQSPDFIHRHALRSRKKTPKILMRHSMYYNRHSMHYGESRDMYTIHSEDQFLSWSRKCLDVSIPAVKVPNSIGDRLIGTIVGSCNGVLCLFHYNKNTISLWNPSIRHVTVLPSPPNNRPASLVGFGFDPSINDYKIVRISQNHSFVYTLKRRVWRHITSPTTKVRGRQELCACLFNGALHWVVTEYYNDERSRYILTFHLTTHVFGKICLPDPNWLRSELTIIDGSLAHIQDEDDRIWILKEYNNVPLWSDAYKFGQFGIKFLPYREGKTALQFTTNGHILLNFTHELCRDVYGVYNPRTGTWDPSMIMRFQNSSCMHIETYVESLVLLDTKLGQKKMNKMKKNKRNEIASHNVTLSVFGFP